MAARRDIELWQRFILAVIALVGGVYLVAFHDNETLQPLGGTMIGTVLMFYFVSSRNGGNGAGGAGGTGGPELPAGKRGRLGLKVARVATVAGKALLVTACTLLPGWQGGSLPLDPNWYRLLGSMAVGACLTLALMTVNPRALVRRG